MDLSLYVVLDRTASAGRDLEVILDATLAGGCRMIQLREKEWPSPNGCATGAAAPAPPSS